MIRERQKDIEAVRKHYKCNGKYLCQNFHDCWFGDGENQYYNCNEFYACYMQCLFDKKT